MNQSDSNINKRTIRNGIELLLWTKDTLCLIDTLQALYRHAVTLLPFTSTLVPLLYKRAYNASYAHI